MTWRPKQFRLGKMREFVTIQAPVETVGATSTGEPVVTWQAFASNVPASVEQTAGYESMRGRQLEAGTRAIFTLRYRSDLHERMRIVHGGSYYGITAINAVEGGRRYLEIMTRTVEA